MTIEINKKDSQWTYRINPYNGTEIDRRANRAAARWYWYARRATPEDAREYLLELERQNKETAK